MISQSPANLADAIAGYLQDRGVRHIFGLPGGENVPLIEAIRKTDLRFILMHHEISAGFAADVTGQLTGTPGVCLSTVGPGAMNLLAGATSATLERSPVLAITAEVDAATASHIIHMNVDLHTIFGSAVKGSFSLTPDNFLDVLDTAWNLALDPPKGAVHLAVSSEAASLLVEGKQPSFRGSPRRPSDALTDEALDSILLEAEEPFLLIGPAVDEEQCLSSLIKLSEAWGIPAAVTPKAKGFYPEDHPLYCGCFSAYGDAALRSQISRADLIIGIGLDGADIVTSRWDIKTPVVSLNGAMTGDPVFHPILEVSGNLSRLLESRLPLRVRNPYGEQRAADTRALINAALNTGTPTSSGNISINELLHAARKALPADGRVTIDVGAFKLVMLQAWQTTLPKTLFVANGMSAMGYAIPGAIALALTQPEKPVMAVVGDGALLMYTGELATVARLGLPLVILVVVDQALALIRLKQLRQHVPVSGTEFNSVDLQHLSAAFCLEYRLIDGNENALRVFQEAVTLRRPVIIEARINVEEYNHFL